MLIQKIEHDACVKPFVILVPASHPNTDFSRQHYSGISGHFLDCGEDQL